MSFVSFTFLVFLPLVWLSFVATPAKHRWALLLFASYLFYASWSVPFILVILLTTSIDYFASKIISSTDLKSRRQLVLTVAITLNVIVLSIFKYFNFFLDAGCSLLSIAGIQSPEHKHLSIILPLGISFYTFEAISYLVDVYRGKAPSPSWLSYNFYIMYFPHLIAGPIVRFNELWCQYRDPILLPSWRRFAAGVELMILGYFVKVVIADNAASIANPVFYAPQAQSTLGCYAGAFAFTAQIFFDFLGYTQIARGASLLFNIELPRNFNFPFSAANISDFWQRWHISLTRWIRDYLFIPMGGSRHGFGRTIFNVFVVMAIAGLWHGAGWNYLIWGIYHGALLIGYHAWKAARSLVVPESLVKSRIYHGSSIFLTAMSIVIGCVIFRSTSFDCASTILSKMLDPFALVADIRLMMAMRDLSLLAALSAIIILMFAGRKLLRLYVRSLRPMPLPLKVNFAVAVAALCFLLTARGVPQFQYFQF